MATISASITACVFAYVGHKESTTPGAKVVEALYTAGHNSLDIVAGSKSAAWLQQPQLLCSDFISLIMRIIIFHKHRFWVSIFGLVLLATPLPQ